MRNLKKFLALALAMVMAFSMILSANALDKYNQVKAWDDKAQVTKEFTEAVDVLSGMKVFQGDDRGFAPGAKITRAETAALIYRLATGDNSDARANLYANYGNFKDVNEGDWFAGYVGYCANAGYIKGHNGYFNPYGNVTGYEALAMILRAVGYDKNHEFEGATWQTNVSALGTRLGVLDDVKNTHYANTLHEPSTREVVASILFNAITKPKTVTWTPALGYETTESTSSSSDNYNTANLGKKIYGLEKFSGIIVGNQDTGESVTRVNKANADHPDYYGYFHQKQNFDTTLAPAKVGDTTTSVEIDAVTGIDMFGHKVHGWKGTTKGVDDKKTYALYDDAVLTALVTANSAKLSDSTYTNATLGIEAQKAGFNVNLTSSKAVFNYSFGVSGSIAASTGVKGETDYTNNGALAMVDYVESTINLNMGDANGNADNDAEDYPLFLLISNSSDKKVDMVVALNTTVSRITQTDAVAYYPSFTVPVDDMAANAGKSTFNGANGNYRGHIASGAVTATSDKTLGTPVVGVAIKGTNVTDQKLALNHANYALNGYQQPANSPLAAAANYGTPKTGAYWYRLSKPTQAITGTVTAYRYDAASHTGSITLNVNGASQTIQRSLLADDIVTETGVNLSASALLYANYTVYLDSEGKYIWAEPSYGNSFVYGTYIDYNTPYASSTYEYTLVGVDLEGNQVKKVVKSVDGKPITNTEYVASVPGAGVLSIPYRDASTGVVDVAPNEYVGFMLNESGALLTADVAATVSDPAALSQLPTRVHQGTKILDDTGAADPLVAGAAAGDLYIHASDAKLGLKQTFVGTRYFTENTKFIVVDGAGVDTQTIKVYNGLTEFLDGATRVKIHGGKLAADGKYVQDDYNLNTMMYYTESPFTYASTTGRNMQIDTIVLPKAALTWEGKSTLYYVGDNTKTGELTVGTNNFTQFEAYVNGEKQSVWVHGLTTDANSSSNTIATGANADHFFALVPNALGLTMPDGTTVYQVADATYNPLTGAFAGGGTVLTASYDSAHRPNINGGFQPIIVEGVYTADTYESQTATITTAAGTGNGAGIYRVSGAKVVNLNAANAASGLIWPGISDLTTLNGAGSLTGGMSVKVSALVDPADPMTVTTIYVQWDQT